MCEYVYVSFFSRVRLVIVAVSAAALVQPTDAIALNGEIAEKQPNRIHHARNHNKKNISTKCQYGDLIIDQQALQRVGQSFIGLLICLGQLIRD